MPLGWSPIDNPESGVGGDSRTVQSLASTPTLGGIIRSSGPRRDYVGAVISDLATLYVPAPGTSTG